MSNLAIIPARSGSKGLKDKNIRLLCGKPLIQYSVDAALKSGVFDEVMVSTDSERYAEIARECGAEVPFLRGDENSGDKSSSWDVVREVLEKYAQSGKQFDMFTLLQPTSPLRTGEDIKGAYKMYLEKEAYSVVSVCQLGHSLNICNTLPDDKSLIGFIRNENKYARQMNPEYFRLNGSIYMCNTEAFLKFGTIYKEKSFAYIMSELSSVDIDGIDDFFLAESMLKNNFGGWQVK